MATPAADVAHLLRRSGFFADSTKVAELATQNLPAIVDWVLDTTRTSGPLVVPALTDTTLSNWEKYVAYGHAWYDRLATGTFPIAEKMTLFWHNHFVSSADKASDASMYAQLALYRANALGNMQSLTQAMAIEPAMLVYLDNATNTKTGPQQNFARELMELFTMGIGNYTENDVIEVARAWTGHGIDYQTDGYVFNASRHDTGNKTIFGITKNWDGPAVITEIFTNSSKRVALARFMVTKLWTYFAHPNPPATVVNDLAQVFITSNYEMTPLLRALFLRPEFYSTTAKQGLLRSPVEFIVAAMHAFGLTGDEMHPEWFAPEMGQQLMRPPNVAGWKWNEYWMGTSAAKARGDFASHIHWTLNNLTRHPLANVVGTPAQVVTALLVSMDFTVSSITRTALEQFVADSRTNNRRWNEASVLVLAVLSPEFNLA
jgi:uncharacterized protein (DUF1800 family)